MKVIFLNDLTLNNHNNYFVNTEPMFYFSIIFCVLVTNSLLYHRAEDGSRGSGRSKGSGRGLPAVLWRHSPPPSWRGVDLRRQEARQRRCVCVHAFLLTEIFSNIIIDLCYIYTYFNTYFKKLTTLICHKSYY